MYATSFPAQRESITLFHFPTDVAAPNDSKSSKWFCATFRARHIAEAARTPLTSYFRSPIGSGCGICCNICNSIRVRNLSVYSYSKKEKELKAFALTRGVARDVHYTAVLIWKLHVVPKHALFGVEPKHDDSERMSLCVGFLRILSFKFLRFFFELFSFYCSTTCDHQMF